MASPGLAGCPIVPSKGAFPFAGPGTAGHRAVSGVRCAGQGVVVQPTQPGECTPTGPGLRTGHGGQRRGPGPCAVSASPARLTPSDSARRAAGRSRSGTSCGPGAESCCPFVLTPQGPQFGESMLTCFHSSEKSESLLLRNGDPDSGPSKGWSSLGTCCGSRSAWWRRLLSSSEQESRREVSLPEGHRGTPRRPSGGAQKIDEPVNHSTRQDGPASRRAGPAARHWWTSGWTTHPPLSASRVRSFRQFGSSPARALGLWGVWGKTR